MESDSVRANETPRGLLTKWVLCLRVFLIWEFEHLFGRSDFAGEKTAKG